jgi:hypothetical protein
VQASGLAAIEALDASLKSFGEVLEAKDKQEVPIKQQEALLHVGQIEEAMVKGFPFEVPKQYADLPQLKVKGSPTLKALPCLSFSYWPFFGGVGEGMPMGRGEEAVVKVFPFEVPKQYADLPQLKVKGSYTSIVLHTFGRQPCFFLWASAGVLLFSKVVFRGLGRSGGAPLTWSGRAGHGEGRSLEVPRLTHMSVHVAMQGRWLRTL